MSNKPALIAYTVRDYKDNDGNDKGRWHEIGAAWPTKSGDGFTLNLFALPTDAKIILMPPSDKPPSSTEG